MLWVRRALGLTLIVMGLAIAVYPSASVSRLQQQVLDEVPLPEGTVIVVEGKPDRALFDDDFVLAYRGVSASIEEVEETLLDAGFLAVGRELEGREAFARDCCGTYDAVYVSVFEGRDGITGLRYSVFDSDIVATWYFIAGFGLLIAGVGLALVVRSSLKSTQRGTSDQTPVPAS